MMCSSAKRDITVAVVDNDCLALRALAAVLNAKEGIRVIWTANLGSVAVRRCLSPVMRPQVAVVDMAMEDLSGLEVCMKIRRHTDGIAIIAVTSYTLATYRADAAAYGVQALVGKSDFNGMTLAIRRAGSGLATQPVGAGIVFEDVAAADLRLRATADFQTQMTEAPLQMNRGSRLSERELRTMRLYAEGQDADDIAAALGVRVSTIRTYERRALRKLGARTRAQGIAMGIRRNLW